MRLRVLHRLRVVRADRRAALLQALDDRDGRRVAHVVGLGLEREAEDARWSCRSTSPPSASTILSIMRSFTASLTRSTASMIWKS